MVRVNLLNPKDLADQHLVAEYDEILMLVSYIRRYPSLEDLPSKYVLGKGHMRFFKDKIRYLINRHASLKKEMIRRGFHPTKKIASKGFKRAMLNDWKPDSSAVNLIKKRIISRLKRKPGFYRYYGEYHSVKFFVDLIKKSKI